MRFGIGVNTEHTLVEAGQQLSLTRERIRQIEARAQRGGRKPAVFCWRHIPGLLFA
jgi:DNA-directed RNA polymerase sigma subunit (sigma70/sigma32)